MKKLLLFAAALLAAGSLFAQTNSIPNPGFEDWVSTVFLNPAGLATSSNNQNAQNGFPSNVFRTTDAYHGSYAAQLNTVKSGTDTVAAYFAYGNPGGGGPSGGVPMSGKPTGFRIHYKYTIKSPDSALVFVQFKKAGTIFAQYTFAVFDTTSTYQLFTQQFSPALTQTPDSVIFGAASSIRVLNSNNNSSGWSPGSIFKVDSVTLTGIATQPVQLNGDLENWSSDTAFTLLGWNIWQNNQPIQTTDAYSGKYAVELVTGTCNGCSNGVSPNAITDGINKQCCGPQGGYPYTLTKDTFELYYKYAPAVTNPHDTAEVQLQFHNHSGGNQSYNILLPSAAGYTKVDFPFLISGFTPDSVLVNIQTSFCSTCSGNIPAGDLGATLKIDALRFFSELPVSVSPGNPSFCAGGSVMLQASGAATYTWTPSTGLSATAGATVTASPFNTTTYTVTGTQGSLVGTQKITVTVNTAPTISISPSAPSICPGSNVDITASGSSISYTWVPSAGLGSTIASTVLATPTVTTNYTVTGTSAAGCTGVSSVNVTLYSGPTLTATASKPTICIGGASVLTASGSVSYSWSPSTGLATTTGSSVNATPTVTTTYTVTGFDIHGCVGTATVTVTIDAPIITIAPTNTSCFGTCNGSAVANVTGGTAPYTYTWSNGQTTNLAYGFCANTYTMTVKDASACSSTQSFAINQPAPITLNSSSTATTCNTADGTATAIPTGGSAPYNYSWKTVPVQTGYTATGLAAGSYSVTMTDANGCTGTTNVAVAGSSGPDISSTNIVQSGCGANNGKATIVVTGGATPYVYSWNNGSTVAVDSSLAAGTYIATVTDKNGCSTFEAVTISDASGPSINVTSVTEISCYGASSGAISITITGGTAPYQYSWSNSATTQNITGLTAGPYQITVTDANGCTSVQTVNITQPANLIATASTTQATCASSNGSVSVTASGGTSPYTYVWNTGATSSSLTGEGAGTYSVTVKDKDGCSTVVNASVSNASGPAVTIDSIVNVTCATGSAGEVTESSYNGTPPYTYLWSNGKTTANIYGLGAGAYALTVTDAAGCVGTANATVVASPLDTMSICMVTVNPASNFNNLLWDQNLASKKVAKYNVYKETTTPGVFGKIGSSPAGTGLYVDTLSDARKRSWRYELSQVDSCGNESPLSLPFKTMHLTINPGSNYVNLIWDNFQGITFNYYIIYRDSVTGVAEDSIDYVTNNGVFTYTDYPPTTTNWYYHMGISGGADCSAPTQKSHSIEAVNYNASKSNTGNVTFVGPTAVNNITSINSVDIYPNPNTGLFTLSVTLAKEKQNIGIRVLNMMGQVLWNESYNNASGNLKKQIDLSAYTKGIYLVQITTDSGILYRKVTLQ